MSDKITINVTPDPNINISLGSTGQSIFLNPVVQGLVNHAATHHKGGSDPLPHQKLAQLQGGQSGEYYHLSSGEYDRPTTGEFVNTNETGQFVITYSEPTSDTGDDVEE